MYKGSISIDVGDDPNGVISLMNKDVEYKRSQNKIVNEKGAIRVYVEADDPVALISSMSGMLKQIRVISEVKALVKENRRALAKSAKNLYNLYVPCGRLLLSQEFNEPLDLKGVSFHKDLYASTSKIPYGTFYMEGRYIILYETSIADSLHTSIHNDCRAHLIGLLSRFSSCIRSYA